jgi:hypothetical protein
MQQKYTVSITVRKVSDYASEMPHDAHARNEQGRAQHFIDRKPRTGRCGEAMLQA